MNRKNIEVEVRGPLSKEEFQNLIIFFETKTIKICDKDRVLLDYSTFLDDEIESRKKDIRLRVTNGVPEIIVKLGEWGEKEQRKELSVFAKSGEFDTLVEIFGELGFSKAMLCERKSKVYKYKGIEFALVEVPNHSYYFEAEKMATNENEANKLHAEIEEVCKELNLKIYDKKAFFEYVAKLNKEANEVFEYDKYEPKYFKNRYDLT